MNDLRKSPGDRESAAHLTIWQVNFADDQILELTQAEIEQDLVAGNLSRENWVWREGMASWLPIADAPEFAKALSTAPSEFRARPDDEVETIPLDPEDDEKTVALKNSPFLAGYERAAPTLEFTGGDAQTAEAPTSRAPAITRSVVPTRITSVGSDKTPAYGSVPPRPVASSAPPTSTRSSAPAAILLRGSAPPAAIVNASAPPVASKVSAPPAATKIPTSPIITPPAAAKSASPSAESPPPLPSRKPVIPVSTTSSPVASARPLPTPSPERPAHAPGSVFPPPSPGAELVAPRAVPEAELAAPKPLPAEPLVATPAPPPQFEDLGLLIPEEMKSDAVWPAPDPSLTRKAAEAAETPLPLRQRPKVEVAPAQPAPKPHGGDDAKELTADGARPRPIGNEPLVIVAGPSETLPAVAEVEKAPPARAVMPKLPRKSAPPLVLQEVPAAKAQLVDIRSSDLMNESTLITGRRRTKHWVSMTNSVIGAICAACIASALTALVMQATEQTRMRAAAPLVAAAPLAAAPTARPEPAAQPTPAESAPVASAAAAQSAEPAVTSSAEAKPEVTPEQPVAAAKAANTPAAKRRPQKASTNPYDDYQVTKSESPKRTPAKPSDDDARRIPSTPGF